MTIRDELLAILSLPARNRKEKRVKDKLLRQIQKKMGELDA